MIAGTFHQGSGLGNQLHRYVATRVLALAKGYEWSMLNPENFKGSSFMDLEIPPLGQDAFSFWNEKKVVENGVDIRSYDPEINFVEDHTIIDGEFQDPRYFEHRMPEIDQWLKVKPLTFIDGESAEDLCVIGFRGGEFSIFPDLFLTKEYWEEGIKRVLEIDPDVQFEVHTDDEETARKFFPDYKVLHDIDLNWRSMRYAKYAIIANSSFFILPRLLAHEHFWEAKSRLRHYEPTAVTIAPRYWARRNTKTWSMPQNYYKEFTYI